MLQHEVSVACTPARAFAVFTEQFATWWPSAYTWSHEVLETIGIEPREGGLCHERGPFGFRCDWGRVLVWEPPQLLILAWQISPRREPVPDPERASTVEVRFIPDGQHTKVRLVHRDFDRHGPGWEEYLAMMGSAQGWPLILERYTAAT